MAAHYDAIIVGGGIGGGALASVLARDGRRILLLEKSTVYEDHVRGEWIAPWGVKEVQRIGLYGTLRDAGGHHLARHITYDETRDPAVAEQTAMPLAMFVPDVPGPLCIGHPHHCQTLFDDAGRAGATTLRGVNITAIRPGATPEVTYQHNGREEVARAPLIVGADGRLSETRQAAAITLHQDKPHHWFTGLLVEGAGQWPDDLQAIGTEGDFGFLAFPQGHGRVRVYGGYALAQRQRFAGTEGPRHFLDAFAMTSSPGNRFLVEGRPAGPLFSYFNNDSWTDEPFAPGTVLIGDAAGWNDPIVGLGLSITYRDVRIVSDILKAAPDWAKADFRPFGEERRERMRRLRFAAHLQAALDMEFGARARARRQRYHDMMLTDPSIGLHGMAVMAGPETAPAEIFTPEHRARVLGEEVTA
ncbi:MAG: FAD-dependent monooxygenase [Alphaproteobacteria bacterium]|nr:FAD-dependent monooxygenase [Alphaproteobacteria bacterium]MBN9556969.1 FAD-dependent monooxygenase [Alphaproteobacteria bacterium]MBN9578096.1 FAD-dependent monooxygenase [Alphaproteobacteria bacterium]MBN9592769.1 FAD-dependent monooxygenase [Alphaproteobacteria bacterium]